MRYLRLFQLLSLLRQPNLTIAGGRGVPWKNAAIARAHKHLLEHTTAGNVAGQLDWIKEVWDELMPRLKLARFKMPKIEV